MVGPGGGNSSGNSGPMSRHSNSNSAPYPPGIESNQWRWNRPRLSGMRPSNFMSGPRRTPYLRPGFFPGPHGPPPPQQQPFFNQRKPRPNWVPRLVRLPHFPAAQPEQTFGSYQQSSNWKTVTPPPTQAAILPEDENSQLGESPSSSHPPKKKKRSTVSTLRPWDREAAELALKTEMEYKKTVGAHALVVRFPDPELSKEIIQRFNSAIDNVHFQGPCSSRYCFVTLREGANVDKVMEELKKIKFGSGYLHAEKKVEKPDENVRPEDIDPFTLFIGNLPANISTVQVKEKFPTAVRIDVGYAQKMKYTRYAFARYSTTEAAVNAYKSSINTIIASRSIVLRFRRNNAPVGPPGEKPFINLMELKAGEKLNVGEKLEAKRKKAKLEKILKAKEEGRLYSGDEDESSGDEKISFEDDDNISVALDEDNDLDDDDDDDMEQESVVDDDDDFDDDEHEDGGEEMSFKCEDEPNDDDADDGEECVAYEISDDDNVDDQDDNDDTEIIKDGEFIAKLLSKSK